MKMLKMKMLIKHKLENQVVDIKLQHLEKEGLISVPITEIHVIKYDTDLKQYYIYYDEKRFAKNGYGVICIKRKISVKVAFKVNINCYGLERENIPNLYLQSDLLDDNIICNTVPKEFELTDIDSFNWAFSKGFYQTKVK